MIVMGLAFEADGVKVTVVNDEIGPLCKIGRYCTKRLMLTANHLVGEKLISLKRARSQVALQEQASPC